MKKYFSHLVGALLICTLPQTVFSDVKPQPVFRCDFKFPKANLCATLTWIKAPVLVELPTEKDQAKFMIEFLKKDPKTNSWKPMTEAPADGVKAKLWMPGMDHGSSPVFVKQDDREKNVYHADHVLFSMEGDWEIWVTLMDKAKKDLDSAKMEYTVEKAVNKKVAK